MKTMVISDLDGTLLHSDARLSEFTVQAINSVIARGVNFTYATARSLNSSLTLTKRLALNLPVITYNGACIKHPSTGEIIEIQSLDEAQVALIAQTLHGCGIHPTAPFPRRRGKGVVGARRRERGHAALSRFARRR